MIALAAALVMGAALMAGIAHAAAPVHDDPALEAVADAAFRRVVTFIYDGRLDSAQATVEWAAAAVPDDPRIGLIRFRVLRENYPDDINEEERAKRMAPKLNAPLDQTIAQCDSILDLDERNEAGILYRGWAHMMKAQVFAIATQIWSAGREARKGKGDLDRYLRLHPKDPDAGVIVGGYLYFADILPRLVKFIKVIARVPAGDRERGLELLGAGAGEDTYTGTDAKVVLAVVDYMFEGKFEEAIEAFNDLEARHPYNPRVCELLGSTAYVRPEVSARSLAALNRVIDGWGTRVRGWDKFFLYRMMMARARILNQIGDYEAARADLRTVATRAPREPFWLQARALLGLSSLAANLGQPDSARAAAQRVLDNPDHARYHRHARALLNHQVSPRQQQIFLELAPVRRQLFGRAAGIDSARTTLTDIRARHGDDPMLTFLEAEIERHLGNREAARAAYQTIVDRGNDPGFETLRLTSLMRLGEIAIAERRYSAAEAHYEEARPLESGASMLGNIIRGRLRFIEQAKD